MPAFLPPHAPPPPARPSAASSVLRLRPPRRAVRPSPRRATVAPVPARARPASHLSPPNADADWVIVDVTASGIPADDALVADVQDDAKTLIRTIRRDAPCELSVALVSDGDILKLNSRWRGVDASTDVLAFPQDDPDRVVLGDVVVSLQTAERQATERGLEVRDELRILVLHAILHLLGYDHMGEIEGDWLVMAQMENRFLKQLGWRGEGLVSAAQQPFYKDIVQP